MQSEAIIKIFQLVYYLKLIVSFLNIVFLQNKTKIQIKTIKIVNQTTLQILNNSQNQLIPIIILLIL